MKQTPGSQTASRKAAWDPLFHERSPLFWPIRAAASPFSGFAAWPSVEEYNRALGEGFPVRFREQPPKPRRRRARRGPVDVSALYDARIHLEGWVPTRPESWHDFLNMLAWVAFPRAKAELHARQLRAMAARLDAAARTLPAARTREQDGLAILDEGGLLVLCEERWKPDLQDALEGRRPDAVREIVRAGGAAVLIFGHALYESLVQPGRAIHAMAHVLPCPAPLPEPAASVALADALLCGALADPESFSRPERFRSLPLDERVLCGG